ncbi:MAG: hypothetical protein ACLQVD_02800 [Capsulimonadaceae bacterium]
MTERTISVQHVNMKIFATTANIDPANAVAVFHRWIQDSVCPEILIDVADYKHVPEGPGIMLIGHEANYSLDETDGKLGLLYNRKTAVSGDAQAALTQAFQAVVAAAVLLEQDEAFAGRLKFDAGSVEVLVNDRLLAPNTDATWEALRPEIETFFRGVYGGADFTLSRRGEPRDRFRVAVQTAAPVEAASVAP